MLQRHNSNMAGEGEVGTRLHAGEVRAREAEAIIVQVRHLHLHQTVTVGV